MIVSKNKGTPKSSILIGFSIINHPFWGTPIFGNIQMVFGRLQKPGGMDHLPGHDTWPGSFNDTRSSLHDTRQKRGVGVVVELPGRPLEELQKTCRNMMKSVESKVMNMDVQNGKNDVKTCKNQM